MSNFVIRELTLYRHFLLVDSPIPFEFIANPTNYNKGSSDFSRVTGLDVCSRPAGCWRVDCWKLLPAEFQKNNPVFTMLLKYDADLLHDGEVVDVRYSDIDVGEGVAGVNGQLVQILPSSFQPVVNVVDALQTSNHADLGLVKSSVDALQTSNHADLGLVKSSVDALQTSNHADLGLVKSSVDAFKSELLEGVAGVSEPLSVYLGHIDKWTKEVRHLVSPIAVGFEPNWSSFVTSIPFNGWAGVYTPVAMPLMVKFLLNGVEVAHSENFFKAGINTFQFGYELETLDSYTVYGVDCEGGRKVFEYDSPYVSGVSALVYCHPVDSLLNN